MTDESDNPDISPGIEELRAERDALAARVDQLEHRRGLGERLRRIAAPVLVVLCALSFLAAGLGVWLNRSTMNSDVWADRVVPLGEDPDVQRALADWTTAELMTVVDPESLFEEALPERGRILAVPLSSAVEGFVHDKVSAFMASDRFEQLWATATVQAHEAVVATLRDERPAVVADDEKVTINFVPLMDAVLAEVLDAAPTLVGSDAELPDITVDDVPDAARQRLADALGVELDGDFGTVTVYDGGKLSAVQQAVKQFDRLVVLTCILTVVLAAGALWVSPRRRRTLLQLTGAAALVLVVVRRAAFAVQDDVVGLVRVAETRTAARVIVASFVNPLTDASVVVLWAVVLVAAVTALTGPYPWARRVRGGAADLARQVGTGLGADPARGPAAAWVAEHADAAKLAGYGLGVLVLWFTDGGWWLLLVVVAAAIGWHVLVDRFAAALSPVPPDAPPRNDGREALP